MAPDLRDLDPRRQRTRDALCSAFVLLALQRRYHDIRVDDILATSGVARSTFYQHFGGKAALLAASMDGAIAILADLMIAESGTGSAGVLLEHFWSQRSLARGVFEGAALRVLRNSLTGQIVERLQRIDGGRLRLPRWLAARALADGMLSPIVAWLAGEAPCGAIDLADALRAASQAMLAGLRVAGGAVPC